jgi:X-X-X-Leu-X-X-Gly heptad repeat protein
MDTAIITYETESFELSSIYAVATPKLLDSSDLKVFDKFDGIYSSINTLVNSSNQIKNGSSTLLQGANKLQEGVQKIKDGINEAYLGSNNIKTQFGNAIDTLNNDNSPAIDNDTLTYIKNQAKQGAVQKVEQSFTDEYKAQIAKMALQELQSNNTYQQLKGAVAQYEAAGIQQLISTCQNITEENQEICMAKANDIAQYKAYSQSVTLMEETAKATAVSTAEKTAKQTAGAVAEEVSGSVANQVATNAKKTATEKTTASLSQLLAGLTQLTSGLNELNLGMDSLNNGTGDLKNGISTLDSGIAQFNSQGISKINELVNGDVRSIEQRIKALTKLSANYTTFDETGENTIGQSKIIMIVDGLSKPKEVVKKIDIIDDNQKSLWEKIKGLFE